MRTRTVAALGVSALCVVLGACSTGGTVGELSVASTGPAIPQEEPSPPHREAGTASDNDADSVAGIASHEETLREFAEAFGVDDPPAIEPVRVVSEAERGRVMAECLTDAGFPVSLDSDGSVGMTFDSQDQISAYNEATYVCMAQYPLDPRMSGELTDSQLRIYYDWIIANPVACMKERGHPVSEPPTLDTFIGNYRSRGEVLFYADGLPSGQEADIMSDVIENCETEPPLDVLFPD